MPILLVSKGEDYEMDQLQSFQLDFSDSTISVEISKLELVSFNISNHFDEIKHKIEEKKVMMIAFYKTFFNFDELDEYLSTLHILALVLDDSMDTNCYSHIIFTGQYESFFSAVIIFLTQLPNPEYLIISDDVHESVKSSIKFRIGFGLVNYQYYVVNNTDSRNTLLQLIKSKKVTKVLNLVSQTNPLYNDIMDIGIKEIITTDNPTEFINFANCQFNTMNKIQNTVNDIYCISSISLTTPIIYKNINITEEIKRKFPSEVYNSNLIDLFLFIYILSDIYIQNPNIYPFVFHEQLFEILQTTSPIKITKTSRLSKLAIITKFSKDNSQYQYISQIPIVNILPDNSVENFTDFPTYICSSDGVRINNTIIHIGVLYHSKNTYSKVDLQVVQSIYYSLYTFQIEYDIDPYFQIDVIDVSDITAKEEIEEVLSYTYHKYNCKYYILSSDYKLSYFAHEYFDNNNMYGISLTYNYNDYCYKHLSMLHLSIYTPITLMLNSLEFDVILLLGSRMDKLITTFDLSISIFKDNGFSKDNNNLYLSEITKDYSIDAFINDLQVKYPNGISIFCSLEIFDSLYLFTHIKDINTNHKYKVIFPHLSIMEIDDEYDIEYYKGHYFGGAYFNIDNFTNNNLVKNLYYMFSSKYKLSQQFFLAYYAITFLLNSFLLTGLNDPQLQINTLPGSYLNTIFGGILFQRNSLFGSSYYIVKYDENNGEMKFITTSQQVQYNMNIMYNKEDTCDCYTIKNSIKLFIIINLPKEKYFLDIIEGFTYYYNLHRLFDDYFILPRVIPSAYGIEKIIEILKEEYIINYNNNKTIGVISSISYDYTKLGKFLEEYNTIMFIPFNTNKISCDSRIINYGFTPSSFGDIVYVSLLIQFNDIVIIHNEEYEIWEKAIDIANGIYNKIHPTDEPHDIKLTENDSDDEDIIISNLVDDIIRLMPNGGFVYSALETDQYHKMLLELEKKSILDKYTSTTIVGNTIYNAIKDPILYRNNIINDQEVKVINTPGNKKLIEIADTININLDDINLYKMNIISNLDSIFITLRMIYFDKKYSSNYDESSMLYSTTFEFPSGATVLDKNNYFQKWWYVGNIIVKNNTVMYNPLYSHRYSQNPYNGQNYKCDVTEEPSVIPINYVNISLLYSSPYEKPSSLFNFLYFNIFASKDNAISTFNTTNINIFPLFEAEDYSKQIENLEKLGIQHIFGATTEEIKYKIIEAIKGKDIILWYIGLEGEYLCNDQVFTFAPTLATYSLSPIYYFTGRGVFDCVVISSSNNMIDQAETKVIKELSNILSVNYKGNITLNFLSDYYIYSFLRFLDDNLDDLGFVIVTIPPQDIKPFLKIFDIIENDYFSKYSFVFLYSDIMSYIPIHYKNNNFYFLSQYYYDATNPDSIDLEQTIYDIKADRNIPHQMIEMLYTTANAARTYFVQLKVPDPSVFRENVNNIEIKTPHGISRLSTDYHFTFPSALLHYLPEELNYETLYVSNSNDNSSVYFSINEPCGMSSDGLFNIGLIVCPEDISSYPLSDIFHFASSTIQYANDRLLDNELLLSLKPIHICTLNDTKTLYQFIKDNNISVVIGYEWYIYIIYILISSSCGILFENWIHKDEYLILSTNPSVTYYMHPNTFHFGVSPTATVYPILSLFKVQMISSIISLYSVNYRNELYFDLYKTEFLRFGMNIINEIAIQWNVTDMTILALDIYNYISHYTSVAIFCRLESPQFISLINTFAKYNITGLRIIYNSPIALAQLKQLNLNGNKLYYVDSLGAISSAINKNLATSEYLRKLKLYEYDYLNGYTSTFLLGMHYLVTTLIEIKTLDIEKIKEKFHEMNIENYFGNTKFNDDNFMNHNLDVIFINSSSSLSSNNNNDVTVYLHSLDTFYSKNSLPLIESMCLLSDLSNVVHKIAILTSISYNSSNAYGEAMIIIGSILDQIVESSKIEYLYQIYDSDNEINNTKELLKKITSQPDVRHIICNLNIFIMKEIYSLIRNDQILWYTRHTTGEYCYKNVINTGPLPNQVFSHLVPHLLFHGYNTCIVYYLNVYPFVYYKDAFLELSKGKISVIIHEYNVNFTKDYEFTRLINNKIPFILLLPKTETYVTYNLLKLNHYHFYNIPICALYYDYLKYDYGYLDGLFFITQFNKTDNLTHFTHILNQYLMTSTGTAPILSSYLAIQFIMKTTKQLNRTDYTIDEFNRELAKQSVYEYKFKNSNYLEHYFFILRYIANENRIDIHSTIQAMVEPLNFYVSSSKNINNTKICNVLSDTEVEIQKQYFILLILSFTGDKAFYDFGLLESMQLSINEINNENILPFKLVLLTENLNCDENIVVDLVTKYINNGSTTLLSIFFSGSDIGRNLLKPIIKENDMLLFYLNIYEGEECEKNIFYCSYTTSHFKELSISFYSVNYPDRNYIFIARNFNYMFSIMYNLFINRHLNAIKYENPNESGDIIANKIIEQYKNEIIIWTDLEEEDLSLLSNKLAQYELDNQEEEEIHYEIFLPSFKYQQTLYYNITNVDFILLYSDENEEFKKYQHNLVASSDTKLISNRMVSAYTMTKLLSKALYNITTNTNTNNNNNNIYFSPSNILNQLYNTEYESPMGLIKVETNNHLRLNLYTHRLESNVREALHYLDLIPNPFSIFGKYENGNHYCDWLIDNEKGDQLEISPIYTLIVTINYDNKYYSDIYRYLFEVLVQFRNTQEDTLAFNKQLPIFLQLKQLEISDKEEEIEERVRNYLNNNDLSKLVGIIGGIFPFERDAIIKGIGNKEVIYFYPGYTEAEYCYANVISTGPVNGMLKEELIYHLHSYKGDIILLTSTMTISQYIYKQIVKVSELAGFNIIKVYEYDHDNNYYLIYNQTVKMVVDMKDNVCLNRECIVINLSSFSYNLIKAFYEFGLLNEDSTWKIYNVIFLEKNWKRDIFPNLHNVYMVSTFYCKSYITEVKSYQDLVSNKIYKYFSNVIPCNIIVEAAISTINLITTTLSRISIYDYNNILTMLHEKVYNSPSGNSVLYPNNFVSKNIYILELNENGTYTYVDSTITPIVPSAYPLFDPNYYGSECIWNKLTKMKLLKDNSFVTVNIIYEGYDYLIETSRTHVYITLRFIDSINTYSQNNNTMFVPYFYIYKNDDELLNNNNNNNSNILLDWFKNDDFGIVIGCLYPQCRDKISQLSIEYNKVFMYTGINDGLFGSKNTISFGISFHQSLAVCMDYFGNGEFKSIVIIVDDTEFGNNLLKEFKAYKLNKNYYIVLKVFQITQMNITHANEIIEIIENNKNVMILNLLYSFNLVNYVKLVIGSTMKIPLHIMFFYNEYLFDVNEIKKLTGDYFFSSFISIFYNVNNLGFISLVRNVISTPITYFMDNNNIALHFISENYIYDLNMNKNDKYNNNVVTADMFLATIFYHSYSGLTGELSVNYNHNLNRKSYLFEIQDSTINALVYPRIADENNVSISSINTNYYGPYKVTATQRKGIFISNIIFLVIAFIAVTSSWLFSIYYRNLQIIKQYNLTSINITMLIYYFFILVGILSLITPENYSICVARIWTVSIGNCAIVITTLVKSLKFQSLVNSTVPSSITSSTSNNNNTSRRRGGNTNQYGSTNSLTSLKSRIFNNYKFSFVKPLFYSLIIQLIYLIIWTISITPKSKENIIESDDIYYVTVSYKCEINLVFLIIELFVYAIILIWCIIFSLTTRNLNTQFKENIVTIISVLFLSIMTLILYGSYFGFEDNIEITQFSKVSGVCFTIIVLILIQYLPIFYFFYYEKDAKLSVGVVHEKTTTWDTNAVKETHILSESNVGKPKRRSDFVLTQDSCCNRQSTNDCNNNNKSLATLSTPRNNRRAFSTSIPPVKEEDYNNASKLPFTPEYDTHKQEKQPFRVGSNENLSNKESTLISSFLGNNSSKKKMVIKGSVNIKVNSAEENGTLHISSGSFPTEDTSPPNMEFSKTPSPFPDSSIEQNTDISV